MIISKEFSAYNPRRYSKPWGARITFDADLKPRYDFAGHYDGSHVVMHAEPRDVVAFGQRDNRGNGTTREFYIVTLTDPDPLVKLTEGEARQHWLAHNPQGGRR